MSPQTIVATVVLIVLTSTFMACAEATDPTAVAEQFIQGEWFFSEEVDVGFHASYNYIFEGSTVQFNGYPPIEWHGHYRILSIENNNLNLELYNLEDEAGFLEDRTLTLTMNPEENTLLIGSAGPFSQ